jgi:biopolymer transport protein ExbB
METNIFTAITNAFAHGGIWMYAILTVHVVSLAIIAERVFFLYFRRTGGQKKLASAFEGDIKKGQIETAMSKAQNIGRSEPIGVVAQAGIQSAMNMGGKEEIHAKMAELISVENANLEKRTSILAMIGNVSTLIGLLGTITGMIRSFGAIANANAIEKANMLSSGISEAMNCTAYGLIVAIPALVMFTVLSNRTSTLQEDLNQGATKILNWLSYNFETVPRKRKSL